MGLRKYHYQKASGGDGVPAELFQVLKDDACAACAALNMPANLEDLTVAIGLEKVSSHSNPKEGQRMLKNVQTTAQLHSFPSLAK